MLITCDGQIASHSLHAIHLSFTHFHHIYLSSPLGYLLRQCSPLILGEMAAFS